MLTRAALQHHFSQEQILLLLTAGVYFKTADAATVNQFIQEKTIDWQGFSRLCRQHGVTAFVYQVWVNHSIMIPEPIAREFKQHVLLVNMTGLKMAAVQKPLYGNLLSSMVFR